MVWRYILAFVLSIAVIALWQHYFPPPRPRAPDPVAGERGGGQVERKERPQPPPGRPAPPAPVEDPTRPARAHKEVPFALTSGQLGAKKDAENVRLRIVADSFGGTVSAVYLPEYRDKDDREKDYLLLDSSEEPRQFLRLELSGHRKIPWNENWEVNDLAEGDVTGVRFHNEIDGLAITKSISSPPLRLPATKSQPDDLPSVGLYHVIASVEFRNQSDQPKTFSYTLYGPLGIDTAATRGGPGTDIHFVAASWTQQGKRVTPESHHSGSDLEGLPGWRKNVPTVAWVGSVNNYFASLFFPYREELGPSAHVARGFATAYLDPERVQELRKAGDDEADAYKNISTGFDSREITLAPGESVVHRYGLFMGPRSKRIVASYEPLKFESVNDYFFLVSFFLSLLEFLKDITFGSWGLAIILLTVLVKLVLHPFNKKSQGNMHRFQKKMAKVKPEMDAVKQRYKDNRLKQNQEMQRLFKEKGINPGQQMGGCLLIFLQLPVWIALYSTLGYALGLRQAQFLWMDDLTKPDRLFELGIGAFGGMFMYFNLLPILYVIFTIVNQRLQPKPEDPQMRSQYQMMTYMMVFFGFIFYSFPAGFMLYIMTSTGLGIFESKMIKAELAKEDAGATGSAPGPGGAAAAGGPMYGSKNKSSAAADEASGGGRGGGGKGKRKGGKASRSKGKR